MYNFSKNKRIKASEKWGLCPMCSTLTRKRSLLFDCTMCSLGCEKKYAAERGGPDAAIFEDTVRDINGSQV